MRRESTPTAPLDPYSLKKVVFDAGIIQAGSNVSGYWPIRGEADPRFLLGSLADLGHQLLLPALCSDGISLVFRTWRPFNPLKPGRFGTWEPWPDQPSRVPMVLLVPMVAFDSKGNRLGYGGGFYDRTLRALRASYSVTAIGLARSFQRLDLIPSGPHDEPMDWVATENGVESFA